MSKSLSNITLSKVEVISQFSSLADLLKECCHIGGTCLNLISDLPSPFYDGLLLGPPEFINFGA